MSKAIKGSQFHLQNLVNRFPGVLDAAIGLGKIAWISPLKSADYAEYHDGEFLNQLGLTLSKRTLKAFWPYSGPRWDALGEAEDGKIILVEAKSHTSEIFTDCAATNKQNITLIEKSLNETKTAIKASPTTDWTKKYYQYANRLAHAYLLNDLNKIRTCLIFIYFVDDTTMPKPVKYSDWKTEIGNIHATLEITSHHPLCVKEIYVDASQGRKGIYTPIL